MPENDLDSKTEGQPCAILGSGFSRAISSLMPTLGELGDQVLEAVGRDASDLDPFGGNLEQWMSYLSVDQPWLTQAQNLLNRSLFVQVADAVNESISRAETATIAEPMPDWLLRLVWTWCDSRTNVFTFNYDTLVERVVSHLGRLGTWGDLYATSLSARSTPSDGGGMWPVSGPFGSLFSLYKLHGSTSWAFGGLDSPPNDRITLSSDLLTWGRPAHNEYPVAPRFISRFDDLVPLIIPPTLTKGPYYANLALRAQWRRAAAALEQAPTLSVIGYSFPDGDLVARQWVSTTFKGSRMDIVDLDGDRPKAIRQSLANSVSGVDRVGEDAVLSYVERECGPLVRWRIWGEGDEVGARLKLTVNGINQLEGIDPSRAPWGKEYEGAQRWLHERVEKFAPGVLDEAKVDGNNSEGSWEAKFVVLPQGAQLVV